ncbi:MAG: alcohol dehydrogenase catalytic domain-containing protein, partial [Actinobacteria bacterium]|nr:alcohol dehydrogenase catalytic domain-containing protein [Actinomycetota bacterium]
MRAWQVHELGDPNEVLKLEEVEEPEPGSGEVVVEVEAAGLNFFDILLCRGEYQDKPETPFTPGGEVAGTISSVGGGVDLEKGLRVISTPFPSGGYAEKVAVPAEGGIFPIPDAMPSQAAAVMHVA